VIILAFVLGVIFGLCLYAWYWSQQKDGLCECGAEPDMEDREFNHCRSCGRSLYAIGEADDCQHEWHYLLGGRICKKCPAHEPRSSYDSGE
jgi:hypothetical protein